MKRLSRRGRVLLAVALPLLAAGVIGMAALNRGTGMTAGQWGFFAVYAAGLGLIVGQVIEWMEAAARERRERSVSALQAAAGDARRAPALADLTGVPGGMLFLGGPLDGAETAPCGCDGCMHLPDLIRGPGGTYRRDAVDHVVWGFVYEPDRASTSEVHR